MTRFTQETPAAQAEFDAEQEYLKTLSYLSPEDQQKYTERQGVSFMYQKPPGYDAAMSKAAEEVGRQAKNAVSCYLGWRRLQLYTESALLRDTPYFSIALRRVHKAYTSPNSGTGPEWAGGRTPLPQSKGEAGEGAALEAAKSEHPQDQQAHQRSQRQPRQELPKNYVANMLGAIGALQKHEKCGSCTELPRPCPALLLNPCMLCICH